MRFIANLLVAPDGTADVVIAATVAAVVSGVPSTTVAALRGETANYARDTVTAAAAVVGAGEWPWFPRVVGAAAVHATVSLGWAAVLAHLLPRRSPIVNGALAGAAIAALDLGVVGRRIPAVRRLAGGPQLADHVAFGIAVAAVLDARRRRHAPASA